MTVFPALVTLLIVMMLAVSSARISQDAGLSAAQRMNGQLARQRAERALRRGVDKLMVNETAESDVTIEQVAISGQAELGDLPMQLYRVTAIGQVHQNSVSVQADYAIDGCASEDDDPCTPSVRRIAWRELSF